MSYEEKDWILRQIKQIAAGLGKMLSRESVIEIVNLEASVADSLTLDELDDILLLIAAEERYSTSGTELTGITEERLAGLMTDFSLLSSDEREVLQKYVADK